MSSSKISFKMDFVEPPRYESNPRSAETNVQIQISPQDDLKLAT